ncbi:hypothetical protein CEXT_616301, partial [Caerostris extrusa]
MSENKSKITCGVTPEWLCGCPSECDLLGNKSVSNPRESWLPILECYVCLNKNLFNPQRVVVCQLPIPENVMSACGQLTSE